MSSLDRRLPVPRLADYTHIRLAVYEGSQAVAQDFVVIHHQNADC